MEISCGNERIDIYLDVYPDVSACNNYLYEVNEDGIKFCVSLCYSNELILKGESLEGAEIRINSQVLENAARTREQVLKFNQGDFEVNVYLPDSLKRKKRDGEFSNNDILRI